jgi:hypothetical protein
LGPWAMANYCRAVTKSLRGTLPHCTAGVAEPSMFFPLLDFH